METEKSAAQGHDDGPGQVGGARLALSVASTEMPASGEVATRLHGRVTRIGSAPDCDLVLEGLEPVHAEVRHVEEGDRDEFVLVAHAPGVRVHGNEDDLGSLRSGARIELGRWELVYYRD